MIVEWNWVPAANGWACYRDNELVAFESAIPGATVIFYAVSMPASARLHFRAT